MDKIKITPLFPTLVVKTNIDREFTEDEIQLFLEDIPMEKERKGMTNHRSKDRYLFDSHADTLGDIKNFCELQLVWYLENIVGANTDLAGLRITQSWLNKTKPQEYHHQHFHKNSYISGVLYISCLPNDSINFKNRSEGNYNNMEFPKSEKKSTIFNANSIGQPVTEGDLLIFPSWVLHYVDVNNTDKERISLSFNTFPEGEMGSYDDATHLKL